VRNLPQLEPFEQRELRLGAGLSTQAGAEQRRER